MPSPDLLGSLLHLFTRYIAIAGGRLRLPEPVIVYL